MIFFYEIPSELCRWFSLSSNVIESVNKSAVLLPKWGIRLFIACRQLLNPPYCERKTESLRLCWNVDFAKNLVLAFPWIMNLFFCDILLLSRSFLNSSYSVGCKKRCTQCKPLQYHCAFLLEPEFPKMLFRWYYWINHTAFIFKYSIKILISRYRCYDFLRP